MLTMLLGALMGIVGRILTAGFVEFTLIKMAEILVKKTSTPYDDQFLEKIKQLLSEGKNTPA